MKGDFLKVYTVMVDRANKNLWYYPYQGETFETVLVVKQTGDSIYRPVFAVVESSGDYYRPPAIVRTIRPSDCVVVKEIETFGNGCKEFFKSIL